MAFDPVDILTDRLAGAADPPMAAMLDRIEAMLAAADSLEEFREMLLAGFPDLDTRQLAAAMAAALSVAQAGGRAALEEDSV